MSNLEKYNNVFMETFEITEDKLAGLKYQDIEAWDSVGHMSLIAALEDAFDIMMDTDDIIDLSSYEKGKEISIPEQLPDGVTVFHAGDKRINNRLVTSGGRVLGVTAQAEDLKTALHDAYAAVGRIRFDNAFYRRDIGRRALEAP